MALFDQGAKMVVGTYSEGVGLWDGDTWSSYSFGRYTLTARTGRGDTFTAAFLVALTRMEPHPAAAFAAEITTRKLQYAGPFRG